MPETVRYLLVIAVATVGTVGGKAVGWSSDTTVPVTVGLFVALVLVFIALDLRRHDDAGTPRDLG